MKVRDIIYREDAPMLKFRIVGESKDFDAWYVEPIKYYKGLNTPIDEEEMVEKGYGRTPRHKKTDRQMVFKDDDRWVVG